MRAYQVTSLLIVLAIPAVSEAQAVWVTSETAKVRPNDPSGAERAAQLEAARNEFESFHLVVFGGPSGAAQLSATAGALTGPGGATIGGADVHIFREGWMNITTPSNSDGATGRWPDAMIPAVDEIYGETRNAFPYDVPPNEQQPLFVEYHVPMKAPPGIYTGSVHVQATGFAADVPVTLNVHGFTLPSTSSLPSAFGLSWDGPCIGHFGSYAACGGDAGATHMLAMYARFALDHRISIDSAVYSGPKAAADGSWDWATWDATYAPLFDGTMPGLLTGAKLLSIRYAWDDNDSSKFAAWAQHFRARGWFDRTFDYLCDEPPNGCSFADIPNRAAIAHAGDPGFRTLVTTDLADATANGVADSIDTLVPVVDHLQPHGAASTRPSYDAWLGQSSDHALWWYQSCDSHGCVGGAANQTSGWPSYMIDAPATLNRGMEWLSWLNRMQGELYYETAYAFSQGDAWSNQYFFYGNGEGTLFYPGTPAKIGGTHDIPVASLRLEMIRAGMQDYEYLKQLAADGDPEMADDEARGLAPTADGFTHDPAALEAARHRIAARIDQLTGASPSPAPAPGDGGVEKSAAASAPATQAAARSVGGCTTGGGSPRGGLLLCALTLLGAALTSRRRGSR